METAQVIHLVEQERTKSCGRCGVRKIVSDFCKNRTTTDGLCWECKDCRNSIRREGAAIRRANREALWDSMTHKKCSRCKAEKPVTEFSKSSDRKVGITPDCKKCRNVRYKDPRKNRTDRIPAKYGITHEHALRTLSSQHGLCANRGCGIPISFGGGMRPDRAVIDHNHQSGKFRAILCVSCNLELGKVEKNTNKTLGLLEYLAQHNDGQNLAAGHFNKRR